MWKTLKATMTLPVVHSQLDETSRTVKQPLCYLVLLVMKFRQQSFPPSLAMNTIPDIWLWKTGRSSCMFPNVLQYFKQMQHMFTHKYTQAFSRFIPLSWQSTWAKLCQNNTFNFCLTGRLFSSYSRFGQIPKMNFCNWRIGMLVQDFLHASSPCSHPTNSQRRESSWTARHVLGLGLGGQVLGR